MERAVGAVASVCLPPTWACSYAPGGKDREMPVGFDHVELVGDLDKSNRGGVEAHLRTVGRGRDLPT